MAGISYDGQSFIIDGRRTWLIGGSFHFSRTPRGQWKSLLRAIREAGINCVETAVCWQLHEPEPGSFRFDEDLDLRHFVQLMAEEGLRCILRPGPFIGSGWDMGGLPAWLLRDGIDLRQGEPRFLQAAARWIDAVMEQVRDLQITEPTGGPILLAQVEHEWFCENDEQGEAYLQQVGRFLHESGCSVPLVNRNNLWQQTTGVIDTWSGAENLFANCRQLRSIQSDAPGLVMGLPTGASRVWGEPEPEPPGAAQLLRRMAEASATGSMFNLEPFVSGQFSGYQAGRLPGSDGGFLCPESVAGAPLNNDGVRGPAYAACKRLCVFLDQFEPLMTHLHPHEHHAVAAGPTTVVQQTGSQGQVVFVWRDPEHPSVPDQVTVTTADGQQLPIAFGRDDVAWAVIDANLDGAGQLDLTNLRPWAFMQKKMLVLFGPESTDALLSIDGTPIVTTVPSGAAPEIVHHEKFTVVILNEDQVDAAYLGPEGLWIGAAGLDDDGQPLPHDQFATQLHVDLAGNVTKKKRPAASKPAAVPKLSAWTHASADAYVKGKAPRYATIDGPTSLAECGVGFGYGWYRMRLKKGAARQVNLLPTASGDRLHAYVDGVHREVIGVGPGAAMGPVPFDLPEGATELVFLADNLGRFSGGLGLSDPRGLGGTLFDVEPLRVAKPKIIQEPRVDAFELTQYIPNCGVDSHGPYPQVAFEVKLTTKAPLVLQLSGDRPRSVITTNGQSIAIDGGGHTQWFVLDQLKKGVNRIRLALFDEEADSGDPAAYASFFKVNEVLSAGADWWYARWQLPEDKAYGNLPKTATSRPAYYTSTFKATEQTGDVLFDAGGLTKGQIFLNGRNVGRYFVATRNNKKVGPQKQYRLPAAWMQFDAPNELIVFDEHGALPNKTKLIRG